MNLLFQQQQQHSFRYVTTSEPAGHKDTECEAEGNRLQESQACGWEAEYSHRVVVGCCFECLLCAAVRRCNFASAYF